VADAVPVPVQPVSAENPFYVAFLSGHMATHTVCGSLCSWETAPTATGIAYFGAVCMRCMRPLMLGEVTFAKIVGG
jgi:hypothetical protein